MKIRRCFVDTNVFLRSVLDDNKEQAKKAKVLFEDAIINKVELKSTILVYFEAYWVLGSRYGLKGKELVSVLLDMLDLKVSFSKKRLLRVAVMEMDKFGYDLEDAFIFFSAKEMEVEEFVSFDQKLVKKFSR